MKYSAKDVVKAGIFCIVLSLLAVESYAILLCVIVHVMHTGTIFEQPDF